MKLEFDEKELEIKIDSIPYSINLNYDRCFGRVVRKYNAITDEVFEFGDLQKYGLRTMLVFEILKKSDNCSDNISVGDLVVVNSPHLLQVNICLNYLIDNMGNEFAVIPEELMMFKVNEKETEIKMLIPQMVIIKLSEIINTANSEYFDLVKHIKSQFKKYEIVDDNGNEEFKKGEKYIIDIEDCNNMFPIKNNEFITTVNNFKIKVE